MDARGSGPLVTIGIPTYNRAAMLRRSIESALNQDYANIDVVVSDNASTDETRYVVETYQQRDARLRYYCSSSNVGPTRNFNAVLDRGAGDFFMWLGDDDWIDRDYVRRCVDELQRNPELTLVSGSPQYYRRGTRVASGRVFELQQEKWWMRVLSYYVQVVDNGMFYGVMRATQLRPIGLPHAMGGDWLTIASIASMGKTRALLEVSVHRELGGASSAEIASALGLPATSRMFPVLALAMGACWHMLRSNWSSAKRSALSRFVLAILIFWIVVARHFVIYVKVGDRLVRARLAKLWPGR